MTANASGTFGSGMRPQPVGIGSTMLSAVNPSARCGSRATPFSLRNSVRVPDVAGGSGAAGVDAGVVVTAAGAADADAAASGVTVTVTVASGAGAGSAGSADALLPEIPISTAEPAATAPITTRQERVNVFIADSPFRIFRITGRAGGRSALDCIHPVRLAAASEPTWNQALTGLQFNRYRAVARLAGLVTL